MKSSTGAVRPVREGLRAINGRVITPEDPAYDSARTVYYGGIDKRPSAVVRVRDVADVRRVVETARAEGCELAVRSGGHSLSGFGTTDNGLVIDLHEMSSISIDANERTAWVETGATALQLTEALASHGLVVGFGDSGSVGVGGITVVGGVGFLVRKLGLTIDSLLAAEIVTADGRPLRVGDKHDSDLFWAIRGAGGNFGVVTRLRFRLRELSELTGGIMVLPATPEIIAGFTAVAMVAQDELSTIANVMSAPPLPFIPEEVHGRLVIFAQLAFAGDRESADRAIAPFRSLATPHADMVKPGPYLAMYQPEDPNFHPRAVVRTMFVDTIDSAMAATIVEHLTRLDAAMRVAQIRVLGGAVDHVPPDATVYAHRSRPVMLNAATFYEGEADRESSRQWATDLWKTMKPNDDGAYVGFLGDDGPARIRAAYPGSTWDRLRTIKSAYDPTNLFRLNHNVPPMA